MENVTGENLSKEAEAYSKEYRVNFREALIAVSERKEKQFAHLPDPDEDKEKFEVDKESSELSRKEKIPYKEAYKRVLEKRKLGKEKAAKLKIEQDAEAERKRQEQSAAKAKEDQRIKEASKKISDETLAELFAKPVVLAAEKKTAYLERKSAYSLALMQSNKNYRAKHNISSDDWAAIYLSRESDVKKFAQNASMTVEKTITVNTFKLRDYGNIE
jgi:hypothetical protein